MCSEEGPIVGRILYDGLSNVITGVSGIAAPGVDAVSNMINQQICPDYWVPDDQITVCPYYLTLLLFTSLELYSSCAPVQRLTAR